jgi:hypothetical protein
MVNILCFRNVKRQLCAGWLTKEAGSGRNWRKRWFILDTEYLSYYKDKKVLFFFLLNIVIG